MCGICGYIQKDRIIDDVLKIMNAEIVYRGPDDQGYYYDVFNGYKIGLAHRRLSVLDLSSNGHQPMESDNHNIVVVFNGEIYNYREIRVQLQKSGYIFHTNTDTEVIIKAYEEWGIDSVQMFNGMFAYALFDKDNESLYLVRDRIGVKPLYYYLNNNSIVFASELKPIMKHPLFQKRIDFEALSYYLAKQYIPRDNCIFIDTYKLLPGTILKWTRNEISQKSYWSVRDCYENVDACALSYTDAKDKLQELLEDSIRLRMISDVPLGAFLSNGVDSSLMVSLMQRVSSESIHTYTVGFVEDGYDESKAAKKVADYLGTNHTEYTLSFDEGKKHLKDIPIYYDEPMADASQIATMLVSKMAKKEVTVAISGDAGDELFCGYNHYPHFRKLSRYSEISRRIRNNKPFEVLEKHMNNRNIDKLFELQNDEAIINAEWSTFWRRYKGLISYNKDSVLIHDLDGIDAEIEEKAMLHDMISYLPDDILTKVDRASMSVSLECRAPLLDYRIVEYALSLPLEYKYHHGEKKRILKDLLYSLVPKELIGQKKKGFGVPYAKWLREDYLEIKERYFSEQFIRKQGIFNEAMLRKIITGFERKNNPNYAKEMWTLFVFQMWYERYMMC